MTQQQPTYSGGQREPSNPRQHPDFTKGNTVALTHGGYALVVPAAAAVLAALLPDLPDYLHQPRYLPAVQAYAVVLARIERVSTWLERLDRDDQPAELTDDGGVRAATNLLLRLEITADRHRGVLGLTPLAAAKLGRDVAAAQVSLLDYWAEGDRQAAQEAADGLETATVPTAEGVTR